MNPFLKDVVEYKRDLDIRTGMIEQMAKHVQLNLGGTYEEALADVKATVGKGGELEVIDPPMLRLIKKDIGERVQDETTFLTYIDEIIESNRIVSPSLVVYERPEVEKSVTAEWLDDNILSRKKSKKEMHRLKQIGELLKSALADYDQNAKKIRINSVSGQRGFPGNPLFLGTGHSSLTSGCRAAAGYGNGTVERFLGGARHYHTPEIVKANISAVLLAEDYDKYQTLITKYNLTYPTCDDVIGMIRRSSDLYWDIPDEIEKIRITVNGMSALERAIFCYSGDFYHLALLNPEFAREFMSQMIDLQGNVDREITTDDELKNLDATEVSYVYALNAELMKGKTTDAIKSENPEGWATVGRTVVNLKRKLTDYSDLINTFFAVNHLPPTVASLKSITRRVCLAADTDSSIFTTEFWVEWYTGELKRGDTADKIWYLMTYMVCQCIAHSLAMLSANMGVETKYLFRVAMKNEYAFPEFALTTMAKHYYSLTTMQEGNVLEKVKMDVKGVGLRGSNSTVKILEDTEALMHKILTSVDTGVKLQAYDVLKQVAQSEIDTIESILAGKYEFLESAQVKPNGNKLHHFDMWQTVFGPKYGMSIVPPYPAVKISTELVNKTATKEWIDGIEDRELAGRLAAWLKANNKTEFPTMYLPTMLVQSVGLPIEIQQAANVRKLAYSINSGYYRILESTGLYVVDRSYHRMVHDFLGMTVGPPVKNVLDYVKPDTP